MVKDGFKVVQERIDDEVKRFFSFIPSYTAPWSVEYVPGEWASRKELCGPLSVFASAVDTMGLMNRDWLVNEHTRVFTCEYEESNDTVLWHPQDDTVLWHPQVESYTTVEPLVSYSKFECAVYADRVKLKEDVTRLFITD